MATRAHPHPLTPSRRRLHSSCVLTPTSSTAMTRRSVNLASFASPSSSLKAKSRAHSARRYSSRRRSTRGSGDTSSAAMHEPQLQLATPRSARKTLLAPDHARAAKSSSSVSGVLSPGLPTASAVCARATRTKTTKTPSKARRTASRQMSQTPQPVRRANSRVDRTESTSQTPSAKRSRRRRLFDSPPSASAVGGASVPRGRGALNVRSMADVLASPSKRARRSGPSALAGDRFIPTREPGAVVGTPSRNGSFRVLPQRSASTTPTPSGEEDDDHIDGSIAALFADPLDSRSALQPHAPGSSEECEYNVLQYTTHLAQGLLPGELNGNVLSLKEKPPTPKHSAMGLPSFEQELRSVYTQNRQSGGGKKQARRHIARAPVRILDGPNMINDYYLNVVDWSLGDVLAVGLGAEVYLWNAATSDIFNLAEFDSAHNPNETVCSVRWMQDGVHIAVGTDMHVVKIYNTERRKLVRVLRGHSDRVSALAWNNHLLSTGSRDTNIHNHDVRLPDHQISTFSGHEAEVCGMAWQGNYLASGGNDNMCCIWDLDYSPNTGLPVHKLTEANAAVKALAWCPWQPGLLATGGGTADRHIRFYNAKSGKLLRSVDAKSQVCQLVWSEHCHELLSAHGYSQNQLTLWQYPSMNRVIELTGHTNRVLHTALSPDGMTVCSAGADETLRFWKIWEAQKPKRPNFGERRKEAAAAKLTLGLSMSVR